MKRFLPLIIFSAMVGLFALMMAADRNPKELKSVLIGKPMPEFVLPAIAGDASQLRFDDLAGQGPILVNFFASWCVPCRAEHDNLMALAGEHGITLYGIAYKDKHEDATGFLEELGNPFTIAAMDLSGRTGIDFGVTGVPETFVVDNNGRIRYRHWGPVVGEESLQKVLDALEKAKVTS